MAVQVTSFFIKDIYEFEGEIKKAVESVDATFDRCKGGSKCNNYNCWNKTWPVLQKKILQEAHKAPLADSLMTAKSVESKMRSEREICKACLDPLLRLHIPDFVTAVYDELWNMASKVRFNASF